MSTLESYHAIMQSSVVDQEMDMASDTEQGMELGNEIDLDLDLTSGAINGEDEDYILEDATPEPQVAGEEVKDDIMYDEVEFGNMQQATSPHDEELDDVVEDDTIVENVDDSGYTAADASSPRPLHSSLEVDQHQISESDLVAPEAAIPPQVEAILSPEHPEDPVDSETEPSLVTKAGDYEDFGVQPEYDRDSTREEENAAAVPDVKSSEEVKGSEGDDVIEPDSAEPAQNYAQKQAGDIASSDPTFHGVAENVDLNENSTSKVPQAHSPKDQPSPMPPVILTYLDDEMSLFPPSDDDASGTYCLEDYNLSEQSLDVLFQSIRLVLGESIFDGDHLLLHVQDLNLRLDELSPQIRSISLSEIQKLHVRLQENDGLQSLDPLRLRLTAHPNELQDLSAVKRAVAQGQGLKKYMSDQEFPEDGIAPSRIKNGQASDNYTSEYNTFGVDSEDGDGKQDRHNDSIHSRGHEDESADGSPNKVHGATLTDENEKLEREEASQVDEERISKTVDSETKLAEAEEDVPNTQHLEEQHLVKGRGDADAEADEAEEIDGDLIDYSEDEQDDSDVKQATSINTQNNSSSSSSTLQGEEPAEATVPDAYENEFGDRTRDPSVNPNEEEIAKSSEETAHPENSEEGQEGEELNQDATEVGEVIQTESGIGDSPSPDHKHEQHVDEDDSAHLVSDLPLDNTEEHGLASDAQGILEETIGFGDGTEYSSHHEDDVFDGELENVDFTQEDEYDYNPEDLEVEADEEGEYKIETALEIAATAESGEQVQRPLNTDFGTDNGNIKRSRNSESADEDDEEQEMKRLRSS